MDYFHKRFTNVQSDCQFFLTLTNKGLLLRFTWFYLAAHKFPE